MSIERRQPVRRLSLSLLIHCWLIPTLLLLLILKSLCSLKDRIKAWVLMLVWLAWAAWAAWAVWTQWLAVLLLLPLLLMVGLSKLVFLFSSKLPPLYSSRSQSLVPNKALLFRWAMFKEPSRLKPPQVPFLAH